MSDSDNTAKNSLLGTDKVPLTEEQIRAATVGELKPLTGLITISDYDPAWSRLFEGEATRIRAALGDQIVLHLGAKAGR